MDGFEEVYLGTTWAPWYQMGLPEHFSGHVHPIMTIVYLSPDNTNLEELCDALMSIQRKSLRNGSSILFLVCHEELRQF